MYEAQTVHKALREGKLEAAEWTHAESIATASIIDRIRGAVIDPKAADGAESKRARTK